MNNLYMGPDGELFPSHGRGREELSGLEGLGKEFNLFVDAIYRAKKNFSERNGYDKHTDDSAIIRMYEERLIPTQDTEPKELRAVGGSGAPDMDTFIREKYGENVKRRKIPPKFIRGKRS